MIRNPLPLGNETVSKDDGGILRGDSNLCAGVEHYLKEVGVTDEQIQTIRDLLLM